MTTLLVRRALIILNIMFPDVEKFLTPRNTKEAKKCYAIRVILLVKLMQWIYNIKYVGFMTKLKIVVNLAC